jgi:hypothetical protein
VGVVENDTCEESSQLDEIQDMLSQGALSLKV